LANLESGQQIIAVDGEPTPTWEAFHLRLLGRIGESGPISFTVKYPDSDANQSSDEGSELSSGLVYKSSAELNEWMAGSEATDLVGGLGLTLYRPPFLAVLEQVVADSPAERAGFKSGDLIISADGEAIADWMAWVDYVRARPNETIRVLLQREEQQLELSLTPALQYDEDNKPFGQVGVSVQWPEWPEHLKRSFSYGPLEAMGEAVERTWSMSVFTLQSIQKMLTGLISTKNLSGPITIAKVASASANSGLESYLGFLALLSVSLGVLNLLPIPVLDGGHIVYYLVELVTKREVSLRIQMLGYQLGLFIIVGVMILALYNDISRL
jgi:regulator of sigma E protease